MRPTRRFLELAGGWLGLALVLALLRIFVVPSDGHIGMTLLVGMWWVLGGLVALAAFIDVGGKWAAGSLTVSRVVPQSVALDAVQDIALKVSNPQSRQQTLELIDHQSESLLPSGLPLEFSVPANGFADLHYQIKPSERGEMYFGEVELRVHSLWGLWQFKVFAAEPQNTRVYPNFAAIAHFGVMQLEQQMGELGIHIQQRRGEGLEFKQLRDFREGDMLRQVDWKATARQRKPISREYQDDRDQQVIFMLDCGRRMRAKDDELSHFDHALNAVLLSGYIALRQGDAVGLMSFAGDERWIEPVKGRTSINRLMNGVYDIRSSTDTSDYLKAAEQLLARQRKRALIIVVTAIQDEDRDDIRAATELLRSSHIVMVASLKQMMLEEEIPEVDEISNALRYCGTQALLESRQRLLATLRAEGVAVVDAKPKSLHQDMIAQYMGLKRSGRI